MSILFISDLHLTPERQATTELFMSFLEGPAMETDHIYILGDLFEYWIGDDAARLTGADEILDALAATNTPMSFIAGNRDFLVGQEFSERCGIDILRDGSVVDLYGHTALLMHGDSLCTDDVSHQAFRATVLDPEWQLGFLAKSIPERIELAKLARITSMENTGSKPMDIMDVNEDAAVDVMGQHGVNLLIHGHTHRPAMHPVGMAGEQGLRIVLGDWYEQASVLEVTEEFLELSASGEKSLARPNGNGWTIENG